jgi:hypothetical protein
MNVAQNRTGFDVRHMYSTIATNVADAPTTATAAWVVI